MFSATQITVRLSVLIQDREVKVRHLFSDFSLRPPLCVGNELFLTLSVIEARLWLGELLPIDARAVLSPSGHTVVTCGHPRDDDDTSSRPKPGCGLLCYMRMFFKLCDPRVSPEINLMGHFTETHTPPKTKQSHDRKISIK